MPTFHKAETSLIKNIKWCTIRRSMTSCLPKHQASPSPSPCPSPSPSPLSLGGKCWGWLNYLNDASLSSVLCVDRSLSELARNDSFWRLRCKEKFNAILQPGHPHHPCSSTSDVLRYILKTPTIHRRRRVCVIHDTSIFPLPSPSPSPSPSSSPSSSSSSNHNH